MNKVKEKIARINQLYYSLGKQSTPLFFQMQTNKEDKLAYSKRLHLFDVDWRPTNFIDRLNNRTTLKNELVFDFDPQDFCYNKTTFEMTLSSLRAWLEEASIPHSFWWSGSRSIHCHAFNDALLSFNSLDRQNIKSNILNTFGADGMLKSEATTITCEYSRNAKTDNYKVPIDVDGDIGWVMKEW